MDRSILYVSRKAASVMESAHAVESIVAQARMRNAAVGITGALVCARQHFAQFVEGPRDQVDDLMHRIEADPRHHDMTILQVNAISRRRLPDWSMAYAGPSAYVARQIEPLVGERLEGDPVRIERLLSIVVGLASPEACHV